MGGKTKEALAGKLSPKVVAGSFMTPLYHKHPVPIGTKYLLQVFNHTETEL